MINLTKNQAVTAEEICLRGELSGFAGTEVAGHPDRKRFGDEILRLLRHQSTPRVQLKAAERIESSVRYMMQNLNKPMKVPVLSAMVGLAESTFFALFKSATGLTPLDFFIRVRMHRAGELLAGTTLQIKEVAALVGYDDQFYFSRMFKSVHGIPPREYRVRQEQAQDHGLKLKSGHGSSAVSYLRSSLSGDAAATKNPPSERVLMRGFQPAGPVAKAYGKSPSDSLLQPAKTCSVSVPQ